MIAINLGVVMRDWDEMHSWSDVAKSLGFQALGFFVLTLFAAAAVAFGVGSVGPQPDWYAAFGAGWNSLAQLAGSWTAKVVAWVVPLLAAVLVTILVWLAIPTSLSIRPYWTNDDKEAQFDDGTGAKGLIEIRLLMGRTSITIGAAYLVWGFWALTWLLGPLVATPTPALVAGGPELTALIALTPVIVVLAMSTGRFARSGSEPLLQLARARVLANSIESKIEKIKPRVIFLNDHGKDTVARRWLWVPTSITSVIVCGVILTAALLVGGNLNFSSAGLSLLGQVWLLALLLVVFLSMFAVRGQSTLLSASSFDEIVTGWILIVLHGLITALLLLGVVSFAFERQSWIVGLFGGAAVCVPTVAWLVPWWPRGRGSPTQDKRKLVLAGNAYRSLDAQLTMNKKQLERLEKIVWDRYWRPTPGWRNAFRRERTNPWPKKQTKPPHTGQSQA